MTAFYTQIIITNLISIALLFCGIVLLKNNNKKKKYNNQERKISEGVIDNSFKVNINTNINIGFFLIILAVILQIFILSKFTYIDILQKPDTLNNNITSHKKNSNPNTTDKNTSSTNITDKNTSDTNITQKNNTVILKSKPKDKNGTK